MKVKRSLQECQYRDKMASTSSGKTPKGILKQTNSLEDQRYISNFYKFIFFAKMENKYGDVDLIISVKMFKLSQSQGLLSS